MIREYMPDGPEVPQPPPQPESPGESFRDFLLDFGKSKAPRTSNPTTPPAPNLVGGRPEIAGGADTAEHEKRERVTLGLAEDFQAIARETAQIQRLRARHRGDPSVLSTLNDRLINQELRMDALFDRARDEGSTLGIAEPEGILRGLDSIAAEIARTVPDPRRLPAPQMEVIDRLISRGDPDARLHDLRREYVLERAEELAAAARPAPGAERGRGRPTDPDEEEGPPTREDPYARMFAGDPADEMDDPELLARDETINRYLVNFEERYGRGSSALLSERRHVKFKNLQGYEVSSNRPLYKYIAQMGEVLERYEEAQNEHQLSITTQDMQMVQNMIEGLRRNPETRALGLEMFREFNTRKDLHEKFLKFSAVDSAKPVAELLRFTTSEELNTLFSIKEVGYAFNALEANYRRYLLARTYEELDVIRGDFRRNIAEAMAREYGDPSLADNPDKYAWAQKMGEKMWHLSLRAAQLDFLVPKDPLAVGSATAVEDIPTVGSSVDFAGKLVPSGTYYARRTLHPVEYTQVTEPGLLGRPEVIEGIKTDGGDWVTKQVLPKLEGYYEESIKNQLLEEALRAGRPGFERAADRRIIGPREELARITTQARDGARARLVEVTGIAALGGPNLEGYYEESIKNQLLEEALRAGRPGFERAADRRIIGPREELARITTQARDGARRMAALGDSSLRKDTRVVDGVVVAGEAPEWQMPAGDLNYSRMNWRAINFDSAFGVYAMKPFSYDQIEYVDDFRVKIIAPSDADSYARNPTPETLMALAKVPKGNKNYENGEILVLDYAGWAAGQIIEDTGLPVATEQEIRNLVADAAGRLKEHGGNKTPVINPARYEVVLQIALERYHEALRSEGEIRRRADQERRAMIEEENRRRAEARGRGEEAPPVSTGITIRGRYISEETVSTAKRTGLAAVGGFLWGLITGKG